jgi:hypothetical protein
MAKAPKQQAADNTGTGTNTSIDDGAEYRVKFRKHHVEGRMEYRPIHTYYMRGSKLKTMPPEKIASYDIEGPASHG